jgi:hypothetical protein
VSEQLEQQARDVGRIGMIVDDQYAMPQPHTFNSPYDPASDQPFGDTTNVIEKFRARAVT